MTTTIPAEDKPAKFPQALPMGTALKNSQYHLKRILGQGGFGITYLARDCQNKKAVAIKEFFPPQLLSRSADGQVVLNSNDDEDNSTAFQQGIERFAMEAKTLARFDHPHIVRVLDFFTANNTAYMVMRFEEGTSLSKRLGAGESFTCQQIIQMLMPLLDALETLHNHGFIHRDIKPGNIYLRRDNTPVLLDFGSAREAIYEYTKKLTIFVTPGYAPVEQYVGRSDRQGPWTDIYALGSLLYRLVSDVIPIASSARSLAVLRKKTDPLTPALIAGNSRCPPYMLSAIDRALNVLEQDRPQTIAQWRDMFSPKAWQTQTQIVAEMQKGREVVLRILDKVQFFQAFSAYEKKRIASNYAQLKRCSPGEYLIIQGERGRSFYILLSGEAQVFQNDEATPLATLTPGTLFGEVAFLTNRRRTSHVVATDSAYILEIDKALMERLGSDIREKIKDRIIEQLLSRLDSMNQRIQDAVSSVQLYFDTDGNPPTYQGANDQTILDVP
ncbi:protein kinase domain-containing protein [Magnetococcales bacterium HHB-1]